MWVRVRPVSLRRVRGVLHACPRRVGRGGSLGASRNDDEGRRLSSIALVPPRMGNVVAMAGAGGGVLDKPDLAKKKDKSPDKRNRRQKPPMYRVMLHNDEFNVREYVVQVLLKTIPGLTVDDAVNIMNEAHMNGIAHVITCAQEEAETYCEGLRGSGLTATIEPSGGGGNGSGE